VITKALSKPVAISIHCWCYWHNWSFWETCRDQKEKEIFVFEFDFLFKRFF